MSTIGISAPAVLPVRTAPAAATRLRLTTRGRRLLVTLAALPVAAGIGFAALSGGSALASGETVATADFDTVTVMPGDTLWAIAEDVAPTEDPRTVINEIEKLNALSSGSLQVGQQLAIPGQYTH
ncbi:LysM peptidoglycan-binding domain-containing protein [Microbacterium sp.]|uniref:LysM peptidoglycan-binding domain-containing protein n=1 Tax=Microbacterium sp. TaxID=51671 RepID=UPI0027352BE3|nr:LysM peptidoglycan-binding domain-containing protein [Microbacterium sp.]MDP3952759.1 LysM peptidoglycan-binding domain-containing protein [Microbacterium sp.]